MPTTFTSDEISEFDRSFQKQFVISQNEVEIAEIFMKNKDKIQAFGELLKQKFDNRKFGGMNPKSDEFGMIMTPPHAFGHVDWKNINVTANTGGGTTNTPWIDSGTGDEMSGSTGLTAPMKVGKPAGHIILGYESFHPEPKAYEAKFMKDEVPLPVWFMHRPLMGSQRKVFQADKPITLPPLSKFASALIGGYDGGDDIPSLIGVTFIHGEYAVEEDPAQWQGTSDSKPAVQV